MEESKGSCFLATCHVGVFGTTLHIQYVLECGVLLKTLQDEVQSLEMPSYDTARDRADEHHKQFSFQTEKPQNIELMFAKSIFERYQLHLTCCSVGTWVRRRKVSKFNWRANPSTSVQRDKRNASNLQLADAAKSRLADSKGVVP